MHIRPHGGLPELPRRRQAPLAQVEVLPPPSVWVALWRLQHSTRHPRPARSTVGEVHWLIASYPQHCSSFTACMRARVTHTLTERHTPECPAGARVEIVELDLESPALAPAWSGSWAGASTAPPTRAPRLR